MIVIDASAVVEALLFQPSRASLVERIASDGDLHAPHLLDVELLSALRNLVLRKKVHIAEADSARANFADLAITKYPHTLLLDDAWGLRAKLSAYDAMYVSLAQQLSVPLITTDARIKRALGATTHIEVF